jgi:hypothetical protein
LFRFEEKQSEEMFISFCFEAQRKDRKRNKQFFGSEIKQKYALLISLWSEAKNSKRKEAKKQIFMWGCETHAKRISFRFEAKIFFLQNWRTLHGVHVSTAKWKVKSRRPLLFSKIF